jgi:short-subunit dehydrogenase
MVNPSPSSQAKVALITGASSGIGYELAKLFLNDGYCVVLVARRLEALQKAAQTLASTSTRTVTTLAADLSQPSAPEEIVAELHRRNLRIQVLVNDAGFGLYGHFANTDLATELKMIQVHVTALTHLTKLLLPDLIKSEGGKILNVASLAAFQPGPLSAVYAASKAYVLSFSEALANELRGRGVSVTTLCPGPTPTAFQQRAGVGLARLSRGNLMSAEAVARIGYRGLMRGKHVVIPGWTNRGWVLMTRILPRHLVVQLAQKVQESRQFVEGGSQDRQARAVGP